MTIYSAIVFNKAKVVGGNLREIVAFSAELCGEPNTVQCCNKGLVGILRQYYMTCAVLVSVLDVFVHISGLKKQK